MAQTLHVRSFGFGVLATTMAALLLAFSQSARDADFNIITAREIRLTDQNGRVLVRIKSDGDGGSIETLSPSGSSTAKVPPSTARKPSAPAADQPHWKEKSRWRQLRQGMTLQEVSNLLGEPERVAKTEFFTMWYWGMLGNAEFDTSGKLNRWTEP